MRSRSDGTMTAGTLFPPLTLTRNVSSATPAGEETFRAGPPAALTQNGMPTSIRTPLSVFEYLRVPDSSMSRRAASRPTPVLMISVLRAALPGPAEAELRTITSSVRPKDLPLSMTTETPLSGCHDVESLISLIRTKREKILKNA